MVIVISPIEQLYLFVQSGWFEGLSSVNDHLSVKLVSLRQFSVRTPPSLSNRKNIENFTNHVCT